MSVESTSEIPPVCRTWLERWFPREDVEAIIADGSPWPAERVVRWTYRVVDAAARQVVAAVLDAAGAAEQATKLRVLSPVTNVESAERAADLLDATLPLAAALGLTTHFLGSTRRALLDATLLERHVRDDGTDFLESIFGDSGSLDMAMYRAIGKPLTREQLVAAYAIRATFVDAGR